MSKWIRWQGLIVFGVLLALVFSVWYFWIDSFVERSIEKTGTRIVGAKVELDKADLHLFPLGITLENLQVTDPESPMSNALEIELIDFSLDGLNLLNRKVIIDSMAVEGARFNRPRKTSGAVASGRLEKSPPPELAAAPSASAVLPALRMPNVQEILADVKLESLEQIKALETRIAAAQKDWQQKLADAPDQKTFERYQARAGEIQKNAQGVAGALTAAKDLQKLQSDVATDLAKLKDFQKRFKQDQAALEESLDRLASAPRQDVERILSNYNLSADGMGNFSQLLFGEEIGATVRKALFWYAKIEPLLTKATQAASTEPRIRPERGRGVHVLFRETAPLPDLLVKQARVSMTIPAGDMRGDIRQVTTNQALLGKPLEFRFSGDKLQGARSIQVQGALDHTIPNSAKDRLEMAVAQYRIKDLALSRADKMPLSLKTGLVDMDLSAALKGNRLEASLQMNMAAAAFETGANAKSSQLQQALQAALDDVTTFSITARADGPLDNYKVQTTSDLDRVLKNAIGGQIQRMTADLREDLRDGVMARVGEPLSNLSKRISGLGGVDQEITSRLNLGDSVSKNLLKSLGGKTKLPF